MPSDGAAAPKTRSATGASLALAVRPAMQSAQQTPAKRKRKDDGDDTESENEDQDDRKTRPLSEELLEALTDLTSHSSRFDVETSKMEVMALLQWHLSDTSRSSKLVYDKKYQRDQNVGWDSEKKSQYLKTVMAGQAATPFVANVCNGGRARLMDGGHRLQALVAFYKGEIPMQIKGCDVYYTQFTTEDKDHFHSRKLQVMEFRSLPFKDEVEFFIQLNSGLPLAPGERLHATTSCNPATKLADLVVRGTAAEDVKTLSKILRKPSTGGEEGRKNELLVMTFFVFTMIFRKRDDPVKLTIADTFLQDVCKLNEEAEWLDSRQVDGKTLDQHKDRVQGLLKRTLDLYKGVADEKLPEGLTMFRCFVACMVAVLEIEEDKLRPEILSTLMASAGNVHLDRIFKKSQLWRMCVST